MNILGEEKQAFLDRQRTGVFDLQYSLSWGTPYDPQSYVSSWRIPAHGDYQAQVGLEKKKWLDETTTKIMVESDDAKRAEMYKDVLTYVNEQSVYLPISYSRTKAVAIHGLDGVSFNDSQYEIALEKMHFSK
jgi:nickel transport system substrate-binding protein